VDVARGAVWLVDAREQSLACARRPGCDLVDDCIVARFVRSRVDPEPTLLEDASALTPSARCQKCCVTDGDGVADFSEERRAAAGCLEPIGPEPIPRGRRYGRSMSAEPQNEVEPDSIEIGRVEPRCVRELAGRVDT